MSKSILGLLILVNLAMFPLVTGCGGGGGSNPANQSNRPPHIERITANPPNPTTSAATDLTCVATDPDADSLSYIWESANGRFSNNIGSTVRWVAPDLPGVYSCTVTVSDGKDIVQGSITFNINLPNRSPVEPYNPSPSNGATNVSTTPILTWECMDPDGDPITYDILFGKSNYTSTVKIDHTEKSFSPGVLENGEFYSWRITAKDGHGHQIISDRWSFRIGQ
jgi:hypothetical protein